MEKKTELPKPKMLWEACGPDLTFLVGDNPDDFYRLIYWSGEIAVRYAAHLIGPVLTDLEPNSRLRLIRRAIEKKWISAHCMTRMVKLYADCEDEYGFDQVPIPWADAVCGKLKPKQRKMIEAACAADDYDWVDFSSTYFSDYLPGRDCQLKMSLPADLRFDSVFRWLCFVVEGHLDPQLRDVHESFHVKSLPDYRRYQNAWRRLTQRPGAADDFPESLTE